MKAGLSPPDRSEMAASFARDLLAGVRIGICIKALPALFGIKAAAFTDIDTAGT
jgi:hypothetical protein